MLPIPGCFQLDASLDGSLDGSTNTAASVAYFAWVAQEQLRKEQQQCMVRAKVGKAGPFCNKFLVLPLEINVSKRFGVLSMKENPLCFLLYISLVLENSKCKIASMSQHVF